MARFENTRHVESSSQSSIVSQANVEIQALDVQDSPSQNFTSQMPLQFWDTTTQAGSTHQQDNNRDHAQFNISAAVAQPSSGLNQIDDRMAILLRGGGAKRSEILKSSMDNHSPVRRPSRGARSDLEEKTTRQTTPKDTNIHYWDTSRGQKSGRALVGNPIRSQHSKEVVDQLDQAPANAVKNRSEPLNESSPILITRQTRGLIPASTNGTVSPNRGSSKLQAITSSYAPWANMSLTRTMMFVPNEQQEMLGYPTSWYPLDSCDGSGACPVPISIYKEAREQAQQKVISDGSYNPEKLHKERDHDTTTEMNNDHALSGHSTQPDKSFSQSEGENIDWSDSQRSTGCEDDNILSADDYPMHESSPLSSNPAPLVHPFAEQMPPDSSFASTDGTSNPRMNHGLQLAPACTFVDHDLDSEHSDSELAEDEIVVSNTNERSLLDLTPSQITGPSMSEDMTNLEQSISIAPSSSALPKDCSASSSANENVGSEYGRRRAPGAQQNEVDTSTKPNRSEIFADVCASMETSSQVPIETLPPAENPAKPPSTHAKGYNVEFSACSSHRSPGAVSNESLQTTDLNIVEKSSTHLGSQHLTQDRYGSGLIRRSSVALAPGNSAGNSESPLPKVIDSATAPPFSTGNALEQRSTTAPLKRKRSPPRTLVANATHNEQPHKKSTTSVRTSQRALSPKTNGQHTDIPHDTMHTPSNASCPASQNRTHNNVESVAWSMPDEHEPTSSSGCAPHPLVVESHFSQTYIKSPGNRKMLQKLRDGSHSIPPTEAAATKIEYERFRSAYPEYQGSTEHFKNLCVWFIQLCESSGVLDLGTADDFVGCHLTEYCALEQSGIRVRSYDLWYMRNDRVTKWKAGIISRNYLERLSDRPKRQSNRANAQKMTRGSDGEARSLGIGTPPIQQRADRAPIRTMQSQYLTLKAMENDGTVKGSPVGFQSKGIVSGPRVRMSNWLL